MHSVANPKETTLFMISTNKLNQGLIKYMPNQANHAEVKIKWSSNEIVLCIYIDMYPDSFSKLRLNWWATN